jgi:hypothetical protein
MTTTSDWLRELGAVRPMAPAGHHVLVLGQWREGHYPVTWQRIDQQRDAEGQRLPSYSKWWILGVETAEQLDRETVERILRAVEGTK